MKTARVQRMLTDKETTSTFELLNRKVDSVSEYNKEDTDHTNANKETTSTSESQNSKFSPNVSNNSTPQNHVHMLKQREKSDSYTIKDDGVENLLRVDYSGFGQDSVLAQELNKVAYEVKEFTLDDAFDFFKNTEPHRIQKTLFKLQDAGFIEQIKKARSVIVTYKHIFHEHSDESIDNNDLDSESSYIPSVSELYKKTQKILRLAKKDAYGYLPDHEKVSLDLLMQELEQEISNSDPKYQKMLGSIFMPRKSSIDYNWGTESVIIHPERWEEPYVQHFLKSFMDLKSTKDRVFLYGDVENDPVYSRIIANTDLKRSIENRKMGEQEYRKLESQLNNYKSDKKAVTTTSLQRVSNLQKKQSELDLTDKITQTNLEKLPDTLLGIEARLTPQTVRKHRQYGVSEIDIVDERNSVELYGTSFGLIHRLREHEIDEDLWDELIQESRDTKISMKRFTEIMEATGMGAEEFILVINLIRPEAYSYAEKYGVRPNRALWRALDVYTENRSIGRTINILQSSHGVYETHDDPIERDQIAFNEMLKNLNYPKSA